MRPLPPFSNKKTTLGKWILLVSGPAILIACNDGSSGGNTASIQSTPDSIPVTESIKLVPGQSAGYLEEYLKGSLRNKVKGLTPITMWEGVVGVDSSPTESDRRPGNYNDTNTQVVGVDEPDLVKYDGQYIYAAYNPLLIYAFAASTQTSDAPQGSDSDFAPTLVTSPIIRILKTTQGSTPSATDAAAISFGEMDRHITGMFLQTNATSSSTTNQLVVLSSQDAHWNSWLGWANGISGKTHLDLFDVTDPVNNHHTGLIEIEGTLIDSRRIGNTLYLVTRYTPDGPKLDWYSTDEETILRNNQTIDELTLDDLLPEITHGQRAAKPLVSSENCYVPESATKDYRSQDLVTISAINLNNPDEITSTCIADYSSGIFASQEALYLFNSQWSDDTIIHKFSLTEQGPAYKGSGTIPGSLGWNAPGFRLTEKDNSLIAVSTVYPKSTAGVPTDAEIVDDIAVTTTTIASGEFVYPTHRVTVLQETDNNELKVTAFLPNEAHPEVIGKPNEDVYAVRYIGNRGYIVTYQKTDPLYVLDLSDIANPTISGELHIEGYSDYLHPIGEQYLIGVGKSAFVENDRAWYQGVQIGLFDVKDLASPQLVKQIEIGGRGTETEVSYNHKAFGFLALDEDSYRMTIPANVHDGVQSQPTDRLEWQYSGLHLFNIELGAAASIESAGTVIAEQSSTATPYSSYVGTQRGIVHDDAVHYVYGNKVYSANWNNPKETTTEAQ